MKCERLRNPGFGVNRPGGLSSNKDSRTDAQLLRQSSLQDPAPGTTNSNPTTGVFSLSARHYGTCPKAWKHRPLAARYTVSLVGDDQVTNAQRSPVAVVKALGWPGARGRPDSATPLPLENTRTFPVNLGQRPTSQAVCCHALGINRACGFPSGTRFDFLGPR